ncbi:MAG: hypothetical protein ACI935_003850 [Moritella dasanensis]|jgi:hypothetical protein
MSISTLSKYIFSQSMLSKKVLAVTFMTAGLSACGNDSNTAESVTEHVLEYQVMVYNDTASQPLSPVLVGLHDSNVNLWAVGLPASDALELMAESGDNSELLTLFNRYNFAVSGAGVIGPGDSEQLTISANQSNAMHLTFSSMLVNTNDAFTGLNAIDISGLTVGDSMTYSLPAYDAGTEANSEAVGTIPGPADGGEGYNVARDDIINKVSRHPGLVTQADDATSVLLPEHRIAGNVGRLVVTRIN